MRNRSIISLVCTVAFVVVALGPVTPSAHALEILLNWDDDATSNPSYDPDGSGFRTAMQAAADYWESIILDNHRIVVLYRWGGDGSWLGLHTPGNTEDGRQKSCMIQLGHSNFDPNRRWYFDPTPLNNSEYNLNQKLYRDLDATEQSDWYEGAVPDVFETWYAGWTHSGSPADAINAYDAFSVALHELGHALGMTGNVASGQISDGDYDVSPIFTGTTMALADIGGDNVYHIEPEYALMDPWSTAGTRTLPDQGSVFAVASASGWTDIDLPRKVFIGTDGAWGTAGNWIGNKAPHSGDSVYLRNGTNVTLDASIQVDTILIDSGTQVTTGVNNNQVAVQQEMVVGGVGGVSRLTVDSGSYLSAVVLTVDTNGAVNIDGGRLWVGQAAIRSDVQVLPGGDLYCAGALDISGDGALAKIRQSGGTVEVVGEMILGGASGEIGEYRLSGSGSALTTSTVRLGAAGSGSFTQSDGTHTVSADLIVGDQAGSTGAYILTGGQINGNRITVGAHDTGDFQHVSGTVGLTGHLWVGRYSGGDGEYTISDGTLNVGGDTIHVGTGGTGVLESSGGTIIANELIVGSGGNLTVGGSTFGTLRVNKISLNAAANETVGTLQIGHGAGLGFGLADLNNAAKLTVTGDLMVGYTATTTNTLKQSGVNSDLDVLGDTYVGYARAGQYLLTGAGASLTTRDLVVGYRGAGSVQHTIGTITALDVILGFDGVTGAYELDGGALGAERILIGQTGAGTFTHDSGYVTADSVAIGDGAQGAYSLAGGGLTATQVDVGETSQGVMTWSGGGLFVDTLTIHTQGRLDVDAYRVLRNTAEIAGGTLDATSQIFAVNGIGGQTAQITLSAGAMTVGTLKLGSESSSNAYVLQTSGTSTIGSLQIAGDEDGQGEYEIQDGTLDVRGGTIEIGPTGGDGRLELRGGTVIANQVSLGADGALVGYDDAVLRVNRLTSPSNLVAFGANMELGHSGGLGAGMYTLTAGKSLLVGGDLTIGQSAGATISQASSSRVLVEGNVHIAAASSTTASYTLDGATAELDVYQNLSVGGTTTSAGGTGTLTVNAGIATVDDVLRIWSGGTVNLAGGVLETDTLRNTSGGTLNFSGGELRARNFIGNLSNPAGTVSPGSSPGVLTVSGNYTQGSVATLEIELGGTARGSQYDALDVSGTMTLDGDLEVVLINGFTPAAGNTFDILDWGSLSGAFDTPLGLPVLSGMGWDTSALYTTGKLSVFSTGPGDREWTGAAGPGSPGGAFASDGNWTPSQAPGAGDRAKFTLDNTYTVQLAADVTNDRAQVSTGTVTLKGAGSPDRKYTLNSIAAGAGLTVVDGQLKIEDLHVDVDGQVMVGASPYAAKLTIDDARLSCDELRLGAGSGPATVEILDGGVLAADKITKAGETFITQAGSEVRANMLSGTFGAFNGALRLGHSGGVSIHPVGTGETLTVGQDLSVGYDAMATLTAGGGDVTVGQRLRIGDLAGSDGTLAVIDANSDLNVTMLSYIGAAGVGRLQLSGGGSARFIQGLQIGASASGNGLISSGGTNSALTVDTNAQVGFAGDGRLDVIAGGSAHVMGWTHLAGQGGSTGAVSVGGSGATLALDGSVYVGGSNTAAGGTGTLTVNNGGAATLGGTLKVWNTGTVNLNGGLLTAPTIQLSGGAFNAVGGRLRTTTFTGNLTNAGAVLGPGASAGTTTINGNYTQGSIAVLEIELGGLTRSSQYDLLDVNGLATLGGRLEVLLINSFNPSAGNTFDVIDWNSRSGEFSELDLPSLASGLLWDTSALYTSGTLAVAAGPVDDYSWDENIGAPPTGDFSAAGNWNPKNPPGPPGATHRAMFTVPNQSYTVRFDDSFTNEYSYVSGSADKTVTFDGTTTPQNPTYKLTLAAPLTAGLTLAGGNLTITDLHVEAAGDVRVGATPTAAKLTIGSGGKLTCRDLNIKLGGGSAAVEVLSGGQVIADYINKRSGGTFTAAAGSSVYINKMHINLLQFDGDVDFGHDYVDAPTAANFTLADTNTLDVGEDFTVGYNAPATFTQEGDVNVGRNVFLGYANGGDGTYNLTGGTLTVGSWVRIETGKFTQSGGVLNGGVHNQGTYRYTGGTLNGYLFNAGVLELASNMTIHGHLGIAADTIVGDNRTVSVDESLEVGGAILTIAGIHGVVNADSALVGVMDDATLRVHNGDLNLQGTLTLGIDGIGRVEVQGGSADLTAENIQVGDTAAGEFVQAGWVEVGDTLTVGSGSEPGTGLYALNDGMLMAETIVLKANGTFQFTGGELRADAFQGNLVNAGGTLAPGNSPGLMTVTGNYTQNSNATLEIELDGTARGSGYDALVVSGTMTLAGELEVVLGFSPSDGDTFDILDWQNLSGTFDTVNVPDLLDGLDWDISELYDNGKITVTPEPATLTLLALGGLTILRRRKS